MISVTVLLLGSWIYTRGCPPTQSTQSTQSRCSTSTEVSKDRSLAHRRRVWENSRSMTFYLSRCRAANIAVLSPSSDLSALPFNVLFSISRRVPCLFWRAFWLFFRLFCCIDGFFSSDASFCFFSFDCGSSATLLSFALFASNVFGLRGFLAFFSFLPTASACCCSYRSFQYRSVAAFPEGLCATCSACSHSSSWSAVFR
jgi:hypothetical protein